MTSLVETVAIPPVAAGVPWVFPSTSAKAKDRLTGGLLAAGRGPGSTTRIHRGASAMPSSATSKRLIRSTPEAPESDVLGRPAAGDRF
jgi:hypothetical protein